MTRRGRYDPSSGLIEYPFPLREGQTAWLFLPRDLTASEGKRLAEFIATLSVNAPVPEP
jgi:hypothetical protein